MLRGESSATEAIAADRDGGNPLGLFAAQVTRAVAAAIFGDPDGLVLHTEASMPLLAAVEGTYPAAGARLLRGLALAEQARGMDGDKRGGLLAEVDEQIGWLAERAVDAPENFGHLGRLLEAERAWAVGDAWAAALAFDAARREVAGRRRPWHQGLITERAARFHLGHGLDQTGNDLLAQARDHYAAWGATAKVAQLDWAYPTPQRAVESTAERGGDQPATPSH